MNDTTLLSDNRLGFIKRIKAINNKIVQNKARYDLDRQTAKIFPLSSGNVSKHEFLTDNDVLPEKYLLEKAAALTRFEYLSLGKELKKETTILVNIF